MRLLLLATLLLSSLTVAAQGFIGHHARLAKKQYEQKAAKARARGEVVDENDGMKLFVTCAKDADALEVANATKKVGAKVRVVKGNLIALEIPYSKLEALAGVKGVGSVDMPPRVSKKTDVTRQVTQAAEVNNGSAPQLPQAYTGKGVIVGVIDGGFDITHPMFKDKDGNLRIKGFYEPGNTTFGGDSVIVYFIDGSTTTLSGSAYSDPEALLDTMKVKDPKGSHGSFCASIAAGSVMDDIKGTSDKPLGGIAPEADILLSDCFYSESGNQAWDIVEAVYYLGNEAEMKKKPLVISISQNSHVGWHNGTSNISNYLGLFAKGEELAIVLCASNEGGDQTYIHERVKAGEPLRLTASSRYTDNSVWAGMKTEKNVKMEVGIMNLTENKEYYRVPITFNSNGMSLDEVGIDFDFSDNEQELSEKAAETKKEFMKYMKGGTLQIWCYQNYAYDRLGTPSVCSELYIGAKDTEWLDTTDEEGNSIQWGLNIYLDPEEDMDLYAWGDQKFELSALRADGTVVKGNGECSIGDWNTSGELVSVGAWCANDQIEYENAPASETGETLGDICFFSSYGTDLAGRKYPDVCAPGSNLVASLSSFDTGIGGMPIYKRKGYKGQFTGQTESRDYFWGTGSGTSASTPATAGIVALWMQAANDMGKKLTCKKIKDIIAHSCDNDKFTEAKPERFGYGKINAYKGLLYVLGIDTSIPTLSKEQPRNVSFRVAGDIVYADGAEDGTSVAVYNLKGVLVRETAVEGGTISTAGLPAGVYALQLGRLGSTLIRK